MVADDDEVRLEHAVELYRGWPTPSSPSCLGRRMASWSKSQALCNWLVLDFLTIDPVPTMAPIRRALGN